MQQIFFSSTLGSKYKDSLERLMFFNPHQSSVTAGIVESIERYGLPRILVERELLRVSVAGLPEVQTLFALIGPEEAAELVGVMIYVRLDQETIVLLHVGIKEEYSLFGDRAESMLLLRLIAKLREIAGRIKNVRSIMVMYGRSVDQRIAVHGFEQSPKSGVCD